MRPPTPRAIQTDRRATFDAQVKREAYGPAPAKISCGQAKACVRDSDCFPITCTCGARTTRITNGCGEGCCLELAATCKAVCADAGLPDAGPVSVEDAGVVCTKWTTVETCKPPSECDAKNARCGCVAKTCEALGGECGSVDDGCGSPTSCSGTCAPPSTCGGGGKANRCGCTPKTCSSAGAACGSIEDGCGKTIACPSTCTPKEWCGGGGAANRCGCVAGAATTATLGARTGANEATIGETMWEKTTDTLLSRDGTFMGGPSSGVAYLSAISGLKASNWLVASNFGLDVPDGSTITGVEFSVFRTANTSLMVDNGARLLKAGVVTGAVASKSGAWPTTPQAVTYGGPGNTFGETLTPADVRRADFGFALSARYTENAGNSWAYVDQITAKVYFTANCN